MYSTLRIITFILGVLMMTQTLDATTREAAVAGTFYPSNPSELKMVIEQALTQAKDMPQEDVKAIIVPHAGYLFSANIAAYAYKTLHKKYKTIFLLGSSHHINFGGVSIYNQGNYKTPLGEVKVDSDIANELIKNNSFITYKPQAHAKEHTLEVQLPFLQYIYNNDFTIVPIILASSELETITQLSHVLEPYFEDDDNLFVISTDLSHYPSYKDAYKVDMNLLQALSTNNTQEFIEAIIANEKADIENLQTSACGWASVLTLLHLTQNKNYVYELLEYKNSGDSPYGEKDRVVGYGALRVYKQHDTNTNETTFTLSDEEKKQLKEIAKLALYEAVLENKKLHIDPAKIAPKFNQHLGAFVTLNKDGKLRGCIGRFEPNQPLYEVIIDMAIAASRYDTRFHPVTKEELSDIEIEISVLTPRKKVSSIDDVVVGKHGIYVEYGNKNGTYLPQVATDMKWDKEEFVRSCCVEKAGIAPEHCKDATLYTYEAIVF